MQVDIRVPVGQPLPQLADFVARCEDAGFHGVGIHDHHHTGRDVYIALALAALRTRTLQLYPATSNSITRNPVVLAALVQSLTEIAPGRIMLTLAPGFLSVEKAGSRPASRDQLRGVTLAVRELLAGKATTLGGRSVQLTHPPPAPPPKVILFASGPRLIELAGEAADGVAMMVGLHPQAIGAARARLRAGAERSGRTLDDLEQIFIVSTAIAAPSPATSWPRRYFRPGRSWLTYPSASNIHWLRAAGIDLPDNPRPEDITDRQAHRICDVLGLFGPAEHCADRLLRARQEAGVEHVFLFPAHTADTGYDLPEAEIAAFRDIVAPRLG